jgi:vanillate/3-O-methylgallate O-demethylase
MKAESLASRIKCSGSAYTMLYDSAGAPFAFPLAPEFTNWRDEQDAWRKTAIFQDMSFHMWNLLIEGRDVTRVLSDLGINSFASFGPMQAKQYVCCNGEGFYVGDAILTCEEENQVYLVGKQNLLNWVRFHIETGKYDARVVAFDKPSPNLADRRLFRFQVQGPKAQAIIEEAAEGSLPPIGFFKMGRFRIGRHEVTALNHRMSGAPGYEIWGGAEIGLDVAHTILSVGKKHGLRRLGGRNYPVTATESGWLSSVVPAIYTGDTTRAYRDWLAAGSYETNASIGGSFPSGSLDDCYLTPFDMGYGFMAKFDHEFCGRKALERVAKGQQRKKIRLVWNSDDTSAIHASMYGAGQRFKYMEMPVANYSTFQMDEVLADGKRVGVSYHPVYSVESRAWISLAVIDESVVQAGRDLTVTWGEAKGGSQKPTVERHVQKPVRVVVEMKAVRRD